MWSDKARDYARVKHGSDLIICALAILWYRQALFQTAVNHVDNNITHRAFGEYNIIIITKANRYTIKRALSTVDHRIMTIIVLLFVYVCVRTCYHIILLVPPKSTAVRFARGTGWKKGIAQITVALILVRIIIKRYVYVFDFGPVVREVFDLHRVNLTTIGAIWGGLGRA